MDPVHVATDGSMMWFPEAAAGSASNNQKVARTSWAVCVIDDHLQQSYHLFPDEDRMCDADLLSHAICVMADAIPSSSSCDIYMAELTAVYRALIMFPIACSLVIWCDSQSVIIAIEKYLKEWNVRRLRSSGRPLLEIIRQLITRKEEAFPPALTTVRFEWQRAHTKDVSIAAVANRIADFAAKRAVKQVSTIVSTVAVMESVGRTD